MVRAWLDSWAGLGHVVEAMQALDYDLRPEHTPFRWWAQFWRTQVAPLPAVVRAEPRLRALKGSPAASGKS